jgi:hypothetical protein
MSRFVATGLMLAAGVALSACAGPRTRTVDLSYAPATPAERTTSGTAGVSGRRVAVATFVDARQKTDRIGTLEGPNGATMLVPARPLGDAVADAVAARLAADGYTVTRVQTPWDPTRDVAPVVDADLVVGGIVDAFEGTSDRRYMWAPSDADVRMRVASATPGQRGPTRVGSIHAELDGDARSARLVEELRERFRAAIDAAPAALALGRSGTDGAR